MTLCVCDPQIKTAPSYSIRPAGLIPPLPTSQPQIHPTSKTVPGIAAYLKETLAPGAVVGVDPTVHPAKFVRALAKTLAAKQIRVRPLGR